MRLPRARVLLVALTLVSMGAFVARADVVNPLAGPFTEATGEMVTGLPSTPSCTTTVVKDKPFYNGYWSQADPNNRPYTGTYTPTCTGPWSKVVLTMSAYVEPGTQFDRIGDVMIGGAELMHFTTPEGEVARTSWQAQRDITPYAGLLSSPQPVFFQIFNVADPTTYTGVFYGTVKLTFYGTDKANRAGGHADVVYPIGLSDTSHGPVSKAITFAPNLTHLTADVFASGHGSSEEDWWDAPFICAGVPYREIGVYVDGRLGGVAPMYPTIYTGGWGPDFWRPIPSPRTFDLRPYQLDLSPFIGLLTDGAPHDIAVNVIDQDPSCSGQWAVAVNLLGQVNEDSNGRTTGALTSAPPAANPTDTVIGDGVGAGLSHSTSTHALTVSGWIQPAGDDRTTTTVVEQLDNTAVTATLAVKSDWHWANTSTTTAGHRTTVDSLDAVYQLIRDGAHWAFVDKADTSTTRDGTQVAWSHLDDRMQSAGPVEGITGVVGAGQESWVYSTSTGVCVDHELAAVAQNLVRDDVTNTCSPSPVPIIPAV